MTQQKILVDNIVNDIMNDTANYYDLIESFVRDGVNKWTLKELHDWSNPV